MTEPDWELFLRETASLIVQQQSPKRWVNSPGQGLSQNFKNACPKQQFTRFLIIKSVSEGYIHIYRCVFSVWRDCTLTGINFGNKMPHDT